MTCILPRSIQHRSSLGKVKLEENQEMKSESEEPSKNLRLPRSFSAMSRFGHSWVYPEGAPRVPKSEWEEDNKEEGSSPDGSYSRGRVGIHSTTSSQLGLWKTRCFNSDGSLKQPLGPANLSILTREEKKEYYAMLERSYRMKANNKPVKDILAERKPVLIPVEEEHDPWLEDKDTVFTRALKNQMPQTAQSGVVPPFPLMPTSGRNERPHSSGEGSRVNGVGRGMRF